MLMLTGAPGVAKTTLRAARISPVSLDRPSDREREILVLMAQGRTNSAICEALCLSRKTVESHVRALFTRLGLRSAPDDHRRVLAVLRYLQARSRSWPGG